MLIRACTLEDVPALECSLPSHGTGVHASFVALQAAGEVGYLAAWHGGPDERDAVALGSVLIRWAGDREADVRAALPEVPAISNLGVAPQFRGRGVGTALVRAAEEVIVAAGRDRVLIGVAHDNARAHQLYLALGYLESGVRYSSSYDFPDANGVLQRIHEQGTMLVRQLSGTPDFTPEVQRVQPPNRSRNPR